MKYSQKLLSIALVIVGLASASSVLAASDEGGAPTPMTPELKSDMANMYQKMADCMKTNQSMERCQEVVMKGCPVAAKTGYCPLMEGIQPMMSDTPMKGMPVMQKGMKHPMGNDSIPPVDKDSVEMGAHMKQMGHNMEQMGKTMQMKGMQMEQPGAAPMAGEKMQMGKAAMGDMKMGMDKMEKGMDMNMKEDDM